MKRDPGLQPERTALAWRRTALSLLVNGALLLRPAVEARSPALGTAALLVLLAAATLVVVGEHRRRALASASVHRAPHAGLAALLLAAVWLACGAALLARVP
jgi:uncharacterized membrane protein YidH (DUF202 family)